MFAGCLQIMWAHSHLIRAENADVCRSYGLCLQAATIIYTVETNYILIVRIQHERMDIQKHLEI